MHRKNVIKAHTRILISALALAASFGASSHAQQPAPLTVERIYSAPSLAGSQLESLAWRLDGKKLTYLRTEETPSGPRTEMWIVDAESGKQQVLIADRPARETPSPRHFPWPADWAGPRRTPLPISGCRTAPRCYSPPPLNSIGTTSQRKPAAQLSTRCPQGPDRTGPISTIRKYRPTASG